MALKPGRGRKPDKGENLKEEVECLVEAGGHMLEDESRDPIRARRFMVRCAAKGLLQNWLRDAARQHGDSVCWRRWHVCEPGEGDPRREDRVW